MGRKGHARTRGSGRTSAIAGALALCVLSSGAVPVAGMTDLAAPAAAEEPVTSPARPDGLPAPRKVADPATYHEFPGAEDSDYYVSSQSPGRIWTDKSVFADTLTVPDDMQNEDKTLPDLEVGTDELIVALSALGSTRHVTSVVPVPIDVVLVLDNSYSMTQCVESSDSCTGQGWERSRAFAMVDAVNSAISIIATDNPRNRVAVVMFGTRSEVLEELGTPTKIADSDAYVSLERAANQGLRLRTATKTRAVGTEGETQQTNIQEGVTTGMGLLANPDVVRDVTGTNQRIPNVILFTDGEPTTSSSSPTWWNPTLADGVQGPGSPGSSQYYGNGFKAALAASLLKAKISDVYNDRAYNAAHGLTDVATSVYTVGLGITALAGNSRDLALATLDPKGNFGSTSNAVFRGFSTAFDAYRTTGTVDVPVNGKNATTQFYTVNRPGPDALGYAAFDPTGPGALKYNTAFYAPVTTGQLKESFEQIAQAIIEAAPNYPVDVSSSDVTAEGYVTFVDELGPYMHVTEMSRLAFCSVDRAAATGPNDCVNATFTAQSKTTAGNVDTYVFEGSYLANGMGGNTKPINLSAVKITVTRSEDLARGDVVTVMIPAGLLPIYDKQVTVDEGHAVTSIKPYISHPVHAMYKVAPKPEVLSFLDAPAGLPVGNQEGPVARLTAGEREALTAYLAANSTDGTVRFYSNAYEPGAAEGIAEARFNPALRNDFYRFSVDSPLYYDESLETQVMRDEWEGLPDETRVYYADFVYITEGASPLRKELSIPTSVGAVKAALTGPARFGDAMVVPAGTLDFSPRIANLDFTKCDSLEWENDSQWCDGEIANHTRTATMVRATESGFAAASGDAAVVTVALGNNGFLEYPAPGTMRVTKQVESSGSTVETTQFRFKVTVGDDVDGQFLAVVYGQDGPIVEQPFTSGETFTMAAGQYAILYGLPHGVTCTVEEVDLPPGYTPLVSELTGTVVVDGPGVSLDFVNRYEPPPVTIAGPEVAKELGRDWRYPESFTFTMCPGTPCLEAVIAAEGATARFPDQTFTTPGTYTYTITEVDGNAADPALSFSAASYQWVVEVEDDKAGGLTAVGTLTQVKDDLGDAASPDLDAHPAVATFFNAWVAGETGGALKATKVVVDETLPGATTIDPTLAHSFTFRYLGADLATGGTTQVSGPVWDGQDTVTVSNVAGSRDVDSPWLTFTGNHVGHTFYYSVEEDAVAGPSFVSHDDAVYFYAITVGTQQAGETSEVTASSVRCKTSRAAIAASSPYGACAPGVGSYGADVVAQFSNTYDAGQTTADLVATKILDGRAWALDDAFRFVLTAADEETRAAVGSGAVTIPEPVTASAAGEGNVEFEGLIFTQQGTYRFCVVEEGPSTVVDGISYDAGQVCYTVTVTNPGSASGVDLVATVTPEGATTFTNTYTASPVAVSPQFVKTLAGRDWAEADAFSFVLEGELGAPLPVDSRATVRSAADAAGFGFGEITFTEAGTYRYTVREVVPDDPAGGMTYDQDPVSLLIVVVDDNLGSLFVESLTYGDGDREFVNTYATSLDWHFDLAKALEGRDLAAGEFEFTAVPDDATAEHFGDDVRVLVPSPAGAQGQVVHMPGPQLSFTQEDAGARYCWTVREVIPDSPRPGIVYDRTVYTVCAAVADDGEGVLTVTTSMSSAGEPAGAGSRSTSSRLRTRPRRGRWSSSRTRSSRRRGRSRSRARCHRGPSSRGRC
ncbi:hypothetical protein ET495_13610 [Xylanimonas allomyrinae]|uniref:VWFA domain-containing protein n=1 Tax=Xylanimonas allomyrinae TaxID=2509459 RepID=A0A4P6ENS4_9MICO|nr:FctA domain-containing protein [Xylanimonas allomyrinae]QAY64086.1 hypothetical protein ET495_13610 [Xylanimonas allomyrinae]